MNVRLLLILFLLLVKISLSQTYTKDWDKLLKKMESTTSPTIKELQAFETTYKNQFKNYPDNTVQFYTQFANVYYTQNQIESASEKYVDAYQYAKQATDTTLIPIAALNLAYFYHNQNYYEYAEKFYNSCMYGMSKIYGPNSKEYTEIFSSYTSLLVDMGKYEQAKPNVNALLFYYKTLDGEFSKKHIHALCSQAVIEQNLGNYTEAIRIFKDIVDEKRPLKYNDSLNYVICVSNLGDVYRETGQFDLALTYLNQAKSLCQSYRTTKSDILATIQNNLGLCYKAYGDSKQAELNYNAAISVYKQLQLTQTESYATTLSNKADLLRGLGRSLEASDLLLTAIEIRKQKSGTETENYANALTNLGMVYYDVGEYKVAIEKIQEANNIYKKVVGENHQSYANSLNCLAMCCIQNKEYKKAEAYKLQALQTTEKAVGKNHYRYASYLISTYELYYYLKELPKAEANLLEACRLIEKNFSKKHELYVHSELLLAEIYLKQGQFEKATPLYFRCLDYYSNQLDDYFLAMSEENQAVFLSSIAPIFNSYNVFLLNYKISQPTKDFSEFTKRLLRYQWQLKSLLASNSSQLKKEVLESKDVKLQSTYQSWLLIKNEIINVSKSTQPVFNEQDLRLKANELETNLKSKLPNFKTKTIVSYDALKEKLSANEAAIELVRTYEPENDSSELVRYAAVIIRNNQTQPDEIIFKNGNFLEKTHFENYYTAIDEKKTDSLSYTHFFQAFEPYLKGITKIFIANDGVFHKVNLSGLYNPTQKKYVMEGLDIQTVASLVSIAKPVPVSSATLQATLFGYPDYEYDFKKKLSAATKQTQQVATRYGLKGLAKLPGTKTEVEEIAKTLKFKNWKVNVFMNELASESNLRKVKSPAILHIATHGYFLKNIENDDKLILGFENSSIKTNSLLRSGLILAGVGPSTADSLNSDSENDGIVTAAEASLLDLSGTELVVLSACQTGLGDDMGTEGVAGLQRSFSIAGAKYVMMSLWPVDDIATQLLMTTFYKNYSQTTDIKLAFRMAQQAVKEKYPHPYYWSAFELLRTFN